MIRQLLRWQDVVEWIAWLDGPASFPLARSLEPRLLVYDRRGAAAPLAADTSPSEAELVRAADLLFLGEPRADRSSWDELARHMLSELARTERGDRRPLRTAEREVCPPVA